MGRWDRPPVVIVAVFLLIFAAAVASVMWGR